MANCFCRLIAMARLLLTVFILIGVLAVATGRSEPINCKKIEKDWNKCKAQGKGSFGLCRSTDEKCIDVEMQMVFMCGHFCEPEPQFFTMPKELDLSPPPILDLSPPPILDLSPPPLSGSRPASPQPIQFE